MYESGEDLNTDVLDDGDDDDDDDTTDNEDDDVDVDEDLEEDADDSDVRDDFIVGKSERLLFQRHAAWDLCVCFLLVGVYPMKTDLFCFLWLVSPHLDPYR